MTLDDDDQTNWNKENIPINEDKATCWQISQNVMQEINQEVTRQVLAELTIKNSDESDENDGEDNDQQSSDIHQSSFPARRSDYFSDFQDNESNANGSKQEQTKIVGQYECSADDTLSKDFHSIKSGEEMEKSFCSGEDSTFSGKMLPQYAQSKRKPLQQYRRTECRSIEFFEERERIAISKGSDNERRSCEGLDEFITPPLYTIPGIELECKLEQCDPKTLSKIILPKMQAQNEQFCGKVDFSND
ncbi:Uncharacterized protein BM_BM475 [Brugia malayi]|uniref:Bm475 n=1 Tax=Brugia malayi TaxID=6279 RepID=A0A4E9FNG5_BRUMA|nr:Uncharacterized protein BM_BM475 [Brugia malayi]VIO98557.1 Uncharacterized protein BM_BM475 [Brugia malayi]